VGDGKGPGPQNPAKVFPKVASRTSAGKWNQEDSLENDRMMAMLFDLSM